MRILHVTHDMGVGGAEQVIRQLVLDADESSFESSVLCLDGQVGAIGDELTKLGVTVHCMSRQPGFDRAIVSGLRRLICEQSIDVVHCHQYTPFSYGVLAAAFTKTRVVFTEHGRFHPDRYSWKRRLLNPMLALLTDEIVAISAATRDALVYYEWLPRSSIRLIYNGVTPPTTTEPTPTVREKLGIEASTFVLGTIARLDPIKNQVMMIEALAALKQTRSDCALILAGDGPERDSLEQLANKLGLQESVFFTGFVTTIAEHLAAMDVFLLTSWSEGTSMTLLEAMSARKAIIATSVGGSIEILEDEVSALFVNAGDTDALVDAVVRLEGDEALRNRLAAGAQLHFSKCFEPAGMLDAYQKLYVGH